MKKNNENLASEIINDSVECMESVRTSLVEIQGEVISIAYKIQKEIDKLDTMTKGVR